MVEESAIEKKYISFISRLIRGTPLYIWQGERGKGFEGRRKKECTKNVESAIETDKYSERFPEYFQLFIALFRTSFSDKNDIFRLKSVIFCILHVCFWTCVVVEYFKYSSIESKKVTYEILSFEILFYTLLLNFVKFYC